MSNEKSSNSLMLLDYMDTIGKAHEMKIMAAFMKYQIQKLNWEKAQLIKGWQGPAEQAFVDKMNDLISRMQTTQNELKETANIIDEISTKIHRTDMELEAGLRK